MPALQIRDNNYESDSDDESQGDNITPKYNPQYIALVPPSVFAWLQSGTTGGPKRGRTEGTRLDNLTTSETLQNTRTRNENESSAGQIYGSNDGHTVGVIGGTIDGNRKKKPKGIQGRYVALAPRSVFAYRQAPPRTGVIQPYMRPNATLTMQ